ncbi:MAG: TraB/GumN family protein [Methylophilales bacterium]|nr:TraB/GumN family protein [Methylophilales bacterium]
MTLNLRKILICFVFFYAMSLNAQQHSNFWEIMSPNGKTHYLYGTIHTDDNRVSNIHNGLINALKLSQIFLMEADEISNPSLLMANDIMYESYLSESEMEKVKYLADFHTMQYEKVIEMKPWLIAVIFDSPRPITPFNLDNLLKTKAIDLGLEVRGIETSEEHFQVLDDLSVQEQMNFLKKVLAKTTEQKESDYEQLLSAYLAQNSDTIIIINEALTSKLIPNEVWLKMKKKLVTDRNILFFDRVSELMRDYRLFIAVGASHLGGDNGLLNQFKKSGYQLKSLPN